LEEGKSSRLQILYGRYSQ